MGHTGYEIQMFTDIHHIEQHLKRIADALETVAKAAEKLDTPVTTDEEEF